MRWHPPSIRASCAAAVSRITHPLAVALILAELGQGPPVVCAALLHDVLEDTGCTLAALRRDFDPEVIDLVDQVTRLDKLDGTACRSLAGPPAASRSIDDSPALAIKLADRLHNMRTLQYLAPAKQEQKSREVLTAFAPLARSLGMDAMERELVDLAAAVLNGPRDDPASGVPAGRARPGRLSRRLLATTVVLLPAADRERWLEEWTAELGTLPSRGNRARLTIEMLVGMPRLAAALRWPVRTARAD